MTKKSRHIHTFDSYTPKRISFLLATKNRAAYLEKFFVFVRDQLVGPEDELIVIDGASTDGTPEVLEKYKGQIDVLISEPDLHGNHAQGKAILLARGKYLKLITDDDVYYRDAIERAYQIMEEHPEIDLLLTGGTKDSDGRVWNYFAPHGSDYGKSTEDVFRYRGATGVGHFIRRSSLAKFGILYPARTNADAALVLQVIKGGGVVRFVRLKTFHHPIFPHSIVTSQRREHRKDTYKLVREYCSLPFYIRHRIRKVLRPLTDAVYYLRVLGKTTTQADDDKIWDGGFS